MTSTASAGDKYFQNKVIFYLRSSVRYAIIVLRGSREKGAKIMAKLIIRYELLLNGIHVAFYRSYREASIAGDRLQKMHRDAVVEIEDASYYD